MPPKINKFLLLCATLLWVIGSMAVAQDIEPDQNVLDSLIRLEDGPSGADSSRLVNDTITPTPINLEPTLYQLGSDSVLINAFATGPDDSNMLKPNSHPFQSPTKALFKSVVFPGWGQFANRKYFKAAVILGLESYLIRKAIKNGNQASDWKEKWQEAKVSGDPLLATYFANYSSSRDDRNTQFWLLALTVFLSMFDAYVDAHLAPFPDRIAQPDELSIDLGYDDRLTAAVTYRF